MTDQLVERFIHAVAEVFPHPGSRDRFGRYIGPINFDPMRQLALELNVGWCDYQDEQVGKVARAILVRLQTRKEPQ